MRLPRPLLCGAGLLFLAACGSSSYSTSPNPGGTDGTSGSSTHTTAVSVNNYYFQPKVDTVAVNSTVTWTWSPGDVNHNVTFQDGPASATQSSGTYQRTFTTAGTYPYYCSIHKTSYGMVGTIVVQ